METTDLRPREAFIRVDLLEGGLVRGVVVEGQGIDPCLLEDVGVVRQAPAFDGDGEAVDLAVGLEGDGGVVDPLFAREVEGEVRPLLVVLEPADGEDVGHVARGEVSLELRAEVNAGAAAHGLDRDGDVVGLRPGIGVGLEGRVDLGLVLLQGDVLGRPGAGAQGPARARSGEPLCKYFIDLIPPFERRTGDLPSSPRRNWKCRLLIIQGYSPRNAKTRSSRCGPSVPADP